MPRFQARDGKRLHWRATVQSASKQDESRIGPKMAWHLVECADPLLEGAHCPEGRLLLAAGGDPDGHCLIDDTCPRCAALETAATQKVVSERRPTAIVGDAAEAQPTDAAAGGPE